MNFVYIHLYTILGGEECQKQLQDAMMPVLNRIALSVMKSNIINLPIYILPCVHLFASKCFFTLLTTYLIRLSPVWILIIIHKYHIIYQLNTIWIIIILES